MTFKIHRILTGVCLIALGLTTAVFSQPAEKYRLRVTPFKSPKDSLALLIELRFWQELREQVEKSEAVQIAGGWNQIVDLLEYAEETQRAPAIFDTSTIKNPKMLAPNAHVQGTIRKHRPNEIEVDVQILQIHTGKQIATEYDKILISTDPFKDEVARVLRRLIRELLTPLDPKLKKQKAWLGAPFDPEKINILVADFTNTGGEVDQRSEDLTSATFNKLDKFMKDDPALSEVAEVKRLSSKGSEVVIREETRAKEIGEALNADMVIWGQNLCVGDSICVFAKAFINHQARTAAIAEEGVLNQYRLLRADLPALIGAKANVLMKVIIGWTYLENYRYQQFQQALKYFQQALSESNMDERQSILGWAGSAADHAGEYELALTWNSELELHQIEVGDHSGLATTYNNIGLIYENKGEWEKALKYYNESEKIMIEVGDRTGLTATYNNIGLIYDNKGEWDKALEYYNKSEKIRLEVGDRAGLATVYNNIGGTYIKKREYVNALKYCGKSEKIHIEVGHRAGLVATYNNIGMIYAEQGELDNAMEYYNKSERLRLKVGDYAGLALSFNNIGWIYEKKGEWEKALEYYEKSEKIRTEVGDRSGLATTYNNIGWIYFQKGEWNKALEYYGKSEKICLEVGDRAGLATTYNNIGLTYDKKGKWNEALEYYEKSEKIMIEVGDRVGLASIYSNLGLIYTKKREWKEALKYCEKSERIITEVGKRADFVATYNNIGRIYEEKGEWDKALEYYGESEKIRIEVRDRVGLATTYNNIGAIYYKKSEWDKALEYYDKSKKIRIEIGDRVRLAITYNNIAATYRKKEDFDQAIQFGEKSLQITSQLGDLITENAVRFGLAQTLSTQKRYIEAVTHLERCVEIDRQLDHPDLKKDLQELLKMQLRAYSASGTRYEMLEQHLDSLNDRRKGDFYRQINDWSRATGYYQNYLRKSQDSLSLKDQAQIQKYIGDGYIKQSKGDSALLYLQPALQAYQKLNDQEMVGTVYNNLGSAHKARQAWPEALVWLRKSAAHNRAVAGDSASVLGFTYYHLADVFLHTQQSDSARYYVEKSLLLRQVLGEAENVKQTRELQERILSVAANPNKK